MEKGGFNTQPGPPSVALFQHIVLISFLDRKVERTCGLHEFQCDSMLCIPREWLCDFQRDCYNGEDETLPECGEFQKLPLSTGW